MVTTTRLRILMLNHNPKWRGTFFRAFHFSRCLARRGHRVTLVTVSPGNLWRFRTENLDGVEVLESPDLLPGRGRTGWDPYDTLRRILHLLKHEDFQLVHGFDCRPVVIFPALAIHRAKGVPFVSDWADWWGRGGIVEERSRLMRWSMGPVETFFEEHFRPAADGITVTSRALRDRAVALGIPGERVRYLPSGCDVENIRPLPKRQMRRELGLPEKARILVYIGFINYDLDCLVRAFPLVQERFPDTLLLMVGQRHPITRRLCRQHRITRGLLETGVVPFRRLPRYLACGDVLLLPFTNKLCNIGRGPIKLGDYMAAGRPIVSMPVGDLRRVFTEDEPIGLLAGDDPASFARAICELLEDPERAEQYGRNARSLAERKYSWELRAAELVACYRALL